MTLSLESLARTIAKARHGFSKEAREAYYRHVRDNCGGWTYFASVNTSKSGWEHEQAFHQKLATARHNKLALALIAQPDGAK